ncbi:MAG: hypothetical protein K8S62_11240 [Candidatus Sabulitectum sp.]|nr:hypothetical protein [Candidatus Sabulitectum sp.]
MKSQKTKLFPFWLLFAVCLLIWLMSSAVSTAPGSSAEKAITFVYPSSLVLTVITGILAIWQTVSSARSRE